jgi:hypothetical protein
MSLFSDVVAELYIFFLMSGYFMVCSGLFSSQGMSKVKRYRICGRYHSCGDILIWASTQSIYLQELPKDLNRDEWESVKDDVYITNLVEFGKRRKVA